MSSKRISELTLLEASDVDVDSDVMAIVDTSEKATKKITVASLIELSSSDIDVGTTPITNGTTGRIIFQGSGNVVQEDSLLHWDNTNKFLGIGVNSSLGARLHARAAGLTSTDYAFRLDDSDGNVIMRVAGNRDLYYTGSVGIGNVPISGVKTFIGTGANGTALSAETVGSGTTNIAGRFKASGSTNNYGLYVDSGDLYLGSGNVGIIANPTPSIGVYLVTTAAHSYGYFATYGGSGGPTGMFAVDQPYLHSFYSAHIGAGVAFKAENPGSFTTDKVAFGASDFGTNTANNVGMYLAVANGANNYAMLIAAGDIRITAAAGTKIGTTNSEKLSFWGASPIVQPTTSVTAATLTGGSGTTLTDTDTFDGYTLKQIVKALRNIGLLA